jgi:hypothetical protein
LCTFYHSQAQQGSFGNTFIHSGGEMTLFGLHNFQNGSTGVLPGIVGTERTIPVGFVSFGTGSSWIGSNATNHVDGYVRSYLTGSLIFPVGDNGVYQPVMLSASSSTSPADVAYFNVSASNAITTSLKGGNEPVLPMGGVFSTTSKDANVASVDNVEYWDINGANPAKITLTWDANSAVGTLTSSILANLSILGWDGTKWVKIPSTVDVTSILGGASSLTAGSITTDATIVPNTYNVYTLGSTFSCNATVAPTLTATTAINICPATIVDLSLITATNTPSGTTLSWHANATATAANTISPGVAAFGATYYAAFKGLNGATVCYGPTTPVTVVPATCASPLAITQPPVITKSVSMPVTGTAPTDLIPTGGTGTITYSNGSGDLLCVAPVGATALPASSNLTISSAGAYSYTTPTMAGTYYFCVKVCDSSSPTAQCQIASYKVIVTGAGCAVGSAIPGVN